MITLSSITNSYVALVHVRVVRVTLPAEAAANVALIHVTGVILSEEAVAPVALALRSSLTAPDIRISFARVATNLLVEHFTEKPRSK